VDLISHVATFSGPMPRNGRAILTVRPGRAAGLRRWAVDTAVTPGGDRLAVPYADADTFAAQIVGYGADVRVEGPPEVRDAVIQQLKNVVARYEPAVASCPTAPRRTKGQEGMTAPWRSNGQEGMTAPWRSKGQK